MNRPEPQYPGRLGQQRRVDAAELEQVAGPFLTLQDFEGSEFGPPKAPGVYVVCAQVLQPPLSLQGAEHALYVGSSNDIYRRVMNPNHPYRLIYDRCQWPVMVFVKALITADFRRMEVAAIRSLRPVLNIRHNG